MCWASEVTREAASGTPASVRPEPGWPLPPGPSQNPTGCRSGVGPKLVGWGVGKGGGGKRVGDGEWGSLLMRDCPLTPPSLVQQGLGLPAGTQLSGSLQASGGEAEASGVLTVANQTASLTLAVALPPSEATLQAKLRHTLPALHAIPPETSLAVRLRREAGHLLGLELRAGTCELRGSGELQLGRQWQWRVLAESSCEALQVSVLGRGSGGPQRLQGPGQGERSGEPWRNRLIRYLLSTYPGPWTCSHKQSREECLPGAAGQPPG